MRTINPGEEILSPRPRLSARFDTHAGLDVPLGSVTRPSWRGRVHLIALCIALPCFALLIIAADSARARVGVALYAAGLCSMLTASVTYHRWVHNLKARAAWRRTDHAMIFAAIAGSSTPVVLIVMPGSLGIALIATMWAVSFAGAGCKLARWDQGDRVGSILYSTASVLAGLSIPALWHRGGVRPALLMLVGGALYIVGANWFSRNWPKLRPAVFSYHEVWHVFTVVAAGANFAAVWAIAT